MSIYKGNEMGQNVKALWGKRELNDPSQQSSWDTVVGACFLIWDLVPIEGKLSIYCSAGTVLV